MSKLPMDLSKFRKVKSDKHTSTFEHHEGHTITVAHNKLSSKMRDSLHKIPLKEKQNYAEGGKVQHYAEGTDEVRQPAESSDKDNYSNLLSEKAKYYQTNDPNLSYGNAIAKAATEVEGRKAKAAAQDLEASTGEQRSYEASMASLPKSPQEAAAQESRAGYPPLQGVQVAGLSPTAGMEELPISPGARLPAAEGLQGPATMPQPATPGLPDIMGAKQQQIAGLQKVGLGQEMGATALGQQGKLNAQVIQAHIDQQKQELENYKVSNEPLRQARQDLIKDINEGHLNPTSYIDKMSTGDRIRTGIGLILGGMGSGLTGGPNLAFQYLQNQIDRDIDSQKADLGKKESLLSHNLRETGDLRDAYNLTRIQSNDILSSQLSKTANETQDKTAAGRLLEIKGTIEQQTAQLQHEAAIARMQMGNAGGAGDPAKMVPLLVPKEHQDTVFKEIKAAENTRKMGKEILAAFDQAVKDNTVMRTGAGFIRTPASVMALHQHMQPTFQDLEGTVRQAAMDNTFKNITPMPGDSDDTIETKRNALNEYLRSKESAPTARAYGIDLSKFGRTGALTGENNKGATIRFKKD